MHVDMIRAWPVKPRALPMLLDATRKYTLLNFDRKNEDLYTYITPNKHEKVNLQWDKKREVSRANKKPLDGVLNRELLLLQSEQDHKLWNGMMTRDSARKAGPTERLRSDTPFETFDVNPADSVYFETYLGHTCNAKNALEALDALCLHVQMHDRSCLLCSALPNVLRENKNLIKMKRNGYFESFVQAEKYIEENKKERHMIQFWQNLYYQFGLIALELNASLLRPPNSMLRSKQCKIVSAYGFCNLYRDKEDFHIRSNMNFKTYQEHYNERHGMLRWFVDTSDNTNLHIDITNLDAIVTRYFARNFEAQKDKVQNNLMSEVFTMESGDKLSIAKVVKGLVKATDDRNYQDCETQHWQVFKDDEQKLYDVAFNWRWNVHNPIVYNKIYEEAHVRSAKHKHKQAKSMTYIMAVEHHRRYKQRTGPSIFWSASAGIT